MEQKKFDIDPFKSPVMQEIAMILSKRLDIEPIRALKMFYESQTCANLHDKSTGLYLYGDPYVADEFMLEIQQQQ